MCTPGLQDNNWIASCKPSWLAMVDVFHTVSGVVDLLLSWWGILNRDLTFCRGQSVIFLQSHGIDHLLIGFSDISPDISAAAVSDHLLWTCHVKVVIHWTDLEESCKICTCRGNKGYGKGDLWQFCTDCCIDDEGTSGGELYSLSKHCWREAISHSAVPLWEQEHSAIPPRKRIVS